MEHHLNSIALLGVLGFVTVGLSCVTTATQSAIAYDVEEDEVYRGAVSEPLYLGTSYGAPESVALVGSRTGRSAHGTSERNPITGNGILRVIVEGRGEFVGEYTHLTRGVPGAAGLAKNMDGEELPFALHLSEAAEELWIRRTCQEARIHKNAAMKLVAGLIAQIDAWDAAARIFLARNAEYSPTGAHERSYALWQKAQGAATVVALKDLGITEPHKVEEFVLWETSEEKGLFVQLCAEAGYRSGEVTEVLVWDKIRLRQAIAGLFGE